MKKLIEDPEKFYRPKERPSGHDISKGFGKANDGAIPPNLLQYANTDSNSQYIRLCKAMNIAPHPARFPKSLPEFFIKFLTDPDDLVVDTFAGSNTTGEVAETLGRRWLAIESEKEYVVTSAFRFMNDWMEDDVRRFVERATAGSELPIAVMPRQGSLLV